LIGSLGKMARSPARWAGRRRPRPVGHERQR
jgi:hypothetical protein